MMDRIRILLITCGGDNFSGMDSYLYRQNKFHFKIEMKMIVKM